MSFDKAKAMRSAEKFLSLGKIRSAISEYQRITENDPKDFSTLNILGDLYVKNSEKQEAVECYKKVAEHYNRQGFAHKAIAIYNKIARIHPNSMEVSAKLAQLYQSKGSIAEARTHFVSLAEQHQRKGQKEEALSIWKQIAELDPSNTDIYLKIAENCQQEDQPDDAARAFTEAGLRLTEQEQFEAAIDAFTKALDIKKNYLRALNGMVKAQIGLGDSDKAAQILEGILEEQPYNRDILYLLVDCHLDMKKAAEAEQAIIKLVEQEPANYPKFLDLVKIYLADNNLDAAARIISMSSEHLLVGGQSEDFLNLTNEILARNPEQLDALRLLVRYYGWQRDETELKKSLDILAEVARQREALDDERYALSQLVMIAPHEIRFAQRLHELNLKHGFQQQEDVSANDLNGAATAETEPERVIAVEVSQESAAYSEILPGNNHKGFEFAVENLAPVFEDAAGNEFFDNVKELDFYDDSFENPTGESDSNDIETETLLEANSGEVAGELKLSDKIKLEQEIESIEFYIAQGYKDLAEKSINTLEKEYGKQAELEQLRLQLNGSVPVIESAPEESAKEKIVENPVVEKPNESGFEFYDEMKNELAIEDNKQQASGNENDYDTHYHTATAYHEMGLMEEAIREFQNAISFIKKSDETRRFFQCANMLGLCFMEKQMPNLALMWYKRALEETKNLSRDEKHALWYELGNAYEKGGDKAKALEYFEQIYALDVGYRDIVKRMQNLQ